MSRPQHSEVTPRSIRVTLPATSANLGPGFDAVGVALSLALTVEAQAAQATSLEAYGRDAAQCGQLESNLILESYRTTLGRFHREGRALRLSVENQIPLGMGCGSSAAARLAGVVLANHFGQLGLDDKGIVALASEMEGHPDNVAACWYGGFTVSVPEGHSVTSATFAGEQNWQLLLALPAESLKTTEARKVLPLSYTREDVVFNLQRAALLTAAFASGQLELLQTAMQDRMHQPQRSSVCSLLQHLEKLQDGGLFAGVALSGAGPALLAILQERTTLHAAEAELHKHLGRAVELLPVRIAKGAATEVL